MPTPEHHRDPAEQPPADPLGLDAIDRQIRVNELTEQVQAIGPSELHIDPDCPPAVHEGFLSNIIAFEHAPYASHFDQLTDAGVDLPHPDSLNDAALTAKLWEVIHALAAIDAFLDRTNHLSDRDLYNDLWHNVLREEYKVMPRGRGWVWVLDILGGCSEEDLQNSLRYYDTEKQRQDWAREFPSDTIPPHVDPPYDRDRYLPKSGIDDPPDACDAVGEHDKDDESDADTHGLLNDDDIPY